MTEREFLKLKSDLESIISRVYFYINDKDLVYIDDELLAILIEDYEKLRKQLRTIDPQLFNGLKQISFKEPIQNEYKGPKPFYTPSHFDFFENEVTKAYANFDIYAKTFIPTKNGSHGNSVVNLSPKSVELLAKVVCGDCRLTPYKSGLQLVNIFNSLGYYDTYGPGFPSRWYYTEEKIRELNGTDKIKTLIEMTFDPREFLGTSLKIEEAATHVNEFLVFDGFEVTKFGKLYKVIKLEHEDVKIEAIKILNHQYIIEQVNKADKKITEGDYDGAITNARTLLEAVLINIFESKKREKFIYSGDLIQLFKDTRKILYLEVKADMPDSVKQILSGLNSIVNGIANMRNTMSDSHATQVKPPKHYAKLAVNGSKILSEFLLDAFNESIS